jgi:hypothetical protein
MLVVGFDACHSWAHAGLGFIQASDVGDVGMYIEAVTNRLHRWICV